MRLHSLLAAAVLCGATTVPPTPSRGIAITQIALDHIPTTTLRGMGWDNLSAPDLFVEIEVEGRVQHRTLVMDNVDASSLPVLFDLDTAFAFAEGQRVRLLVYDKDVASNDLVAVSDYLSTRSLANYLGRPQSLAGSGGARFTVYVTPSF